MAIRIRYTIAPFYWRHRVYSPQIRQSAIRTAASSGFLTLTAEARCDDGHIGKRGGEPKTTCNQLSFRVTSETDQALVIAMQCPDVVGMLLGPRHRGIES